MTERNIPPQELKSYEDSVNAYRDIVNAIKTAEKKKYAEGRAEGRAEVARKMLRKGIGIDVITEMTGLSADEVVALKD